MYGSLLMMRSVLPFKSLGTIFLKAFFLGVQIWTYHHEILVRFILAYGCI